MPPTRDDEIDRLYQGPLAQFTAERNALAKRLGADGASIRTLEKPTLAAWAVNQLYWRRRPVFARLVAAADARRAAHAKRLGGHGGDVDAAERAHQTAVRAAADEIRSLLAETGDAISPATMNAITETLQALPGPPPHGRWTQPLTLAGFEALAGLVPTSARTLRGLTAEPASPPKAKTDDIERDARAIKKAADARKRERSQTEQALREARKDATKAEAALARARRELASAKAERERLQDQLLFAMKRIDDASAEVRTSEQAAAQTKQEQSRLEAQLAKLKEAQ